MATEWRARVSHAVGPNVVYKCCALNGLRQSDGRAVRCETRIFGTSERSCLCLSRRRGRARRHSEVGLSDLLRLFTKACLSYTKPVPLKRNEYVHNHLYTVGVLVMTRPGSIFTSRTYVYNGKILGALRLSSTSQLCNPR
jgi:hypothetical protein